MKKLLLMALSVAVSSTVFVGCSTAKEEPEVRPHDKGRGQHQVHEPQRREQQRPQQANKQQAQRRGEGRNEGRGNIDPALAQEMKTLVTAYKADQSPENKAKLVDCLGKMYDARIASQTKRIQDIKTALADNKTENKKRSESELARLEKQLAESNREAEIEKSFARAISNEPRQPRNNQENRPERKR